MKKNLLSTLVLSVLSVFAFAQIPSSFEWRVENDTLVNSTTYQFDVNIYNTSSTAFEIKGGTVAFLFNDVWRNGGTIAVSISNVGLSTGQNTGAIGYVSGTIPYVRKILTTVGATLGTQVPANSKVRLFTMVLTNSVSYLTNATPNITWKFNASPAAGFLYTDAGGLGVSVVGNGVGIQNTNQQYCFSPVYYNGTWNSKSPHAGTDSIFSPTSLHDAVVYNGAVTDGITCRNYNLWSGTTHNLNSATLNVSGNINAYGTLSSTSGAIQFSGPASSLSTQTTNVSLLANKVTINSGKGVSLGGNLTVNDTLSLKNGNIFLANNNLIMGSSAKRLHDTAVSYIVTNGIGTLNISNIGSTMVTFPVGTSKGYSPIRIQNTGTIDNFQVSVSDSITAAGAKLGVNAVNKTWNVKETTPGGSILNVNLRWNSITDELPSFTQANSYVSYINNLGRWQASVQSNATNLYTTYYFQTLNGVALNNSFGSFGVASSGTLPISLMSFSGVKKASSVELNWKTASEINGKEFQVERMDNGGNFIQIGSVKAVGNTNKLTAYSFVDFTASKQAIRYYRLKMVDLDGKYKYSNTIKIADENGSNEVVVYPNPTNDKISIANSNLNFAAVSYKVMNLTGDVVKFGTSSVNEINVSDLAAGMYLLSVVDEANEAVTVKFIKK